MNSSLALGVGFSLILAPFIASDFPAAAKLPIAAILAPRRAAARTTEFEGTTRQITLCGHDSD